MTPEKNPAFEVQGDPNTVDSFAACLSAVAAHFGRRSDYAYIEALTGTCFSPCHNRGEDCVGWKLDGGSAARVQFIAEALGLTIDQIDLVTPDEPASSSDYFSRVRQSFDQGKAVVLATWPAWSILTGWDDDLAQLPFVTTPRFEGVVSQIWPPIKTRLAFAFSRGNQALDERAVMRAALRYGADIATGRVVPGVENFGNNNYFGGEMYDVIVNLAGQEYLCAGCGENGCFSRAVKRIADGHQASLGFLNEAHSLFERERSVLAQVIVGYQNMAEISSRYVFLAQESTQAFDRPELRADIKADFTRLKQLHLQTAQQFDVLQIEQ